MERVKVAPEVCSYTDDEKNKLTVEIRIPGVSKEEISLKMYPDSFALSAPRNDIEYATTLSFCCPVIPEEAKAKYESGLLKIEVPFKDSREDAIKIKVR
jgi:HSP20 family molecular chaperone IbpA